MAEPRAAAAADADADADPAVVVEEASRADRRGARADGMTY